MASSTTPRPKEVIPEALALDLDKKVDTLPFSKEKQSAILWYLATDEYFYQYCEHQIRARWFANTLQGDLWEIIRAAHAELNRLPKKLELRQHRFILSEEPVRQQALLLELMKAEANAGEFGLDSLRTDLNEWLHATILTDGMDMAISAYREKDFHKAFQILSDRVNTVQELSFDPRVTVDMSDPLGLLRQCEEGYAQAATSGLSILDAALSPDGTPERGGYFIGDTTILMGPSNAGKSAALITHAVANATTGRSVLYMIHEGRKLDLYQKMMSCALDADAVSMFSMIRTPAGQAVVQEVGKSLNENIDYVVYQKAGMCVEDVVPLIRQMDRDRRHKTGRGYDLLISDYPAKLSTHKADKGNLQRRHIDQIVYDYYVALAAELETHCLVGIQVNREGNKSNNRQERLLDMTDVLESWDVMTMATNVITMNRSDEDAAKKRLTYYVAKSRSSDKGWAVACNTNYAAAKTHSDELGAFSYRGRSILQDQEFDRFMDEYRNSAIPLIAGPGQSGGDSDAD